MNLLKIKEELEDLLNDLNNLDEELSQKECNDFIRDIEDIKDSLRRSGNLVVKKLSRINFAQATFGFADPDEMESALNEVERQAKKILRDLDTGGNNPSSPNGPINIHVAPNFSQSQNQQQILVNDNHINVGKLIAELDNEMSKTFQDKPKQKSLIQKILGYEKEYAPAVIEVILKHWPKF